MWRIELFGEPRLIGYGQVINRFESRRAVALLAYLALHPQSRHPREVLADRIWPDAPLDAARNRLKQALASLRRLMEPPTLPAGSVLDADRAGIGLRPGAFTCDVDEFRRLVDEEKFAEALQTRKGDLLPGFYDDWLEDIRLELSTLECFLDSNEPVLPSPVEFQPSKTRIHIPAAVSTFIGREKECDGISKALGRSRWVTVTGFGGIGKTRATQQVGRHWSGGGVYFVPLAGLDEVRQVPYAIFSALGAEPPPGDPVEGVPLLLSEPTLLILDNAESLPAHELGALLIKLLECCPELKVLVSSRIPIRCAAEAVFPLLPLQVPGPEVDPEALLRNESVRLFVERARNARPDFQVTSNNAPTVAAICSKLEGSPLAIELCAAWSRLGTTVLLAKLQQGQSLLSARKGAIVERHESTARVFESTCALLSPEALRLLGQISLFRSGFELSMLDSYCLRAPTPESVSELIEASLLVPEYESEPERFSLLESVRQHAEGLLSEQESDCCSRRFVELFARMSGMAAKSFPDQSLGISDQAGWVKFLSRNWGCFHDAALMASETAPGLAEAIVFGTEWFWSLYIPSKEIVRALRSSPSPRSRLLEITYLNAVSSEEQSLADHDEFLRVARELNDESLCAEVLLRKAKLKVLRQNMNGVAELARASAAGFRNCKDQLNLGLALHILYNVAIQAGDKAAAHEYRSEAEECFRTCGSQVNLAALAYTQCRELYIREDFAAALGALYSCRDIAAGLQSLRFMAWTANLFGVVLRHLGDDVKARVYFYLALVASLRIRDPRGSHIPMWNLFLSLGKSGRYREGTVVMGYAMAVHREHFGGSSDAEEAQLLSDFVDQAKEAIGQSEFAAAEAEGRSLHMEDMERKVSGFLASDLARYQAEVKAFLVD